MLLYIIRHGETYGNINGDGFSETPLTPTGKEQARLLGERFKNEQIAKIYTSTLGRAVETAQSIKKYHPEAPFIIDGDIMEMGTDPEYAGLPEEEILKIAPQAQIRNRKPLGEEDDSAVFARAKRVIEKIKAENSFNSTVILVAHGTVNSFFVTAALGLPYIENFNFSHVNTGVTLVAYVDEGTKIQTKLKYLNDVTHLWDGKSDENRKI